MSAINGVQVYRELSASIPDRVIGWLEARQQLYPTMDPKGNEHLFIDNDLPRDVDITTAIVANTAGFALFTEEGEFVGSYRSLDRALAAQAGARLVVTADVEADPDEEVDPE